ncbi:MAG: hypothetical protein QOJ63_413, partial [Solirubrobacteraceae bacterium]|nr:hypothetical protein [Solirubrobacteraceae bacterium]
CCVATSGDASRRMRQRVRGVERVIDRSVLGCSLRSSLVGGPAASALMSASCVDRCARSFAEIADLPEYSPEPSRSIEHGFAWVSSRVSSASIAAPTPPSVTSLAPALSLTTRRLRWPGRVAVRLVCMMRPAPCRAARDAVAWARRGTSGVHDAPSPLPAALRATGMALRLARPPLWLSATASSTICAHRNVFVGEPRLQDSSATGSRCPSPSPVGGRLAASRDTRRLRLPRPVDACLIRADSATRRRSGRAARCAGG